jgi:geranylgeranylglycerol-phosphate geranylgeranyltransferase
MSTLVAYLWLMRVHSSVAAVMSIVAVAVLLNENPWSAPVVTASLVVSLVTGAGNALNDYHDRQIDTINKQSRPLPSGAISPEAALAFSWMLFGFGIAACLWLDVACLVVALLNSGLLVWYAKYSKRWGIAKNLVVSYLVGSVFLFASLAVHKITLLVAILGVCASLATLSREIVKDIEDAEADRASGARTLALTLGTPKARRLAFSVLGGSVVLALVPYGLRLMHEKSLLLILLGAVMFARGYRLNDAGKAQKYIMAGSLVELCAFVFARS